MFLSVFSDELFMDSSKGLPVIKSWGLDYVDFRGRVNGKGIEYQTDEELKALRRQLNDLGLKVGALQSSLCKVNLPDPARRKEEEAKLEGLIRAADALDCRLVRSFNYWQHHDGDAEMGQLAVRPDEMDKVLGMFQPIAKRAREAGLILAFENCGQTSDEAIALADALGVPEWGLAWDVSNYLGLLDESPEDAVTYYEKCLGYARMLHVKATSIVPELEGIKAPWDRVLRGALATGRDMPVSIETHTPKDAGMTQEACTHRCVQLIRKAWPTEAPGSVASALEKMERFERSYKDDPVRFVVVGLGMGRARCRQLLETQGCALYGVVDINEEKARGFGNEFNIPYSTNIEDFLSDPAVEVMYVVLPTGIHGEVAEKCLRAGKHVLTTKPMDVSAENCQRMIDVAKEKGLLLGVDFDKRQNESTMALKKAISSGWFGHLLSVNVTLNIRRTQAYYDENGAWRGTWRYDGGGALCNQGVHEVDDLQYLLGMPQRVRAQIRTQTHAIETEDIGWGEWDYGNQLVVRFFSTTSYPMSTWYARMELFGSAGAYVSTGGGPEGSSVHYGKDNQWSREAPYPVARQWQQASDAFASAVRLGTPVPVTGEEGIKSRSILDAMYQSARHGGEWVQV